MLFIKGQILIKQIILCYYKTRKLDNFSLLSVSLIGDLSLSLCITNDNSKLPFDQWDNMIVSYEIAFINLDLVW